MEFERLPPSLTVPAPQPREGAGEDQTLAMPAADSQSRVESALVACVAYSTRISSALQVRRTNSANCACGGPIGTLPVDLFFMYYE
jgi:hypothetical protein